MSAPPSTPIRSSPAEVALCRSGLWEALALGFRPPTAETIARLAAPEGATALGDLAAVLDAGEGAGLAPLARRLALEPPPSLETLHAAYGRFFGHTARGAAPPYETEYGEDSLWAPTREMADLGAFLRAFGLRLAARTRERLDHIACECEFLLVLARREARAAALGETSVREETRRAARLFVRDHLGRWAPALGATLGRLDPEGFYGALGRLLAAFVAAECGRLGVAAGPDFFRLRSTAPDDTPMACGPLVGAAEP